MSSVYFCPSCQVREPNLSFQMISSILINVLRVKGLSWWLSHKESAWVLETACSAGDVGSIPGSGRSPGEGNPLQYSCLGSPMERGALQATVHRVAKRPSNTTLPLNYNNKRMLTATHNNPKFCELYYFHEVHAFCHVSYKQLPFLVSFILETSFISPCIAPF